MSNKDGKKIYNKFDGLDNHKETSRQLRSTSLDFFSFCIGKAAGKYGIFYNSAKKLYNIRIIGYKKFPSM
ncbi:MAG: hypothetical protein Tsb0015_07100 [Simkaniaceae bacterium]